MDAALRELHKPTQSNVPILLVNFAAVAAGVYSLASGWPTTHPLWIAAAILWLAYFQNCWMIIFHEDAHYTLYPTRRWQNIMNGTILGTLMFVPFHVYREVHIRHHGKMNSPGDFELWPYTDPRMSLAFRRIFVFIDIIFGIITGPYIYGRMFWVKDSPIREPRVRRRIALEYVLMVVFWGALLSVVAYYNAWWQFLLAFVIPAWVTAVFQTLRKLTEHLGLPAGDALAGARTVVSESLLGRIRAWTSLHIEAHGLHHKYPQMPHENLERAVQKIELSPEARIYPTYWHAFRDMLPHLLRPGIGVNAAIIRGGRSPTDVTAAGA